MTEVHLTVPEAVSARLGLALRYDDIVSWWLRPNCQLDGKSPEDCWLEGHRKAILNLVEDMLAGNPT